MATGDSGPAQKDICPNCGRQLIVVSHTDVGVIQYYCGYCGENPLMYHRV